MKVLRKKLIFFTFCFLNSIVLIESIFVAYVAFCNGDMSYVRVSVLAVLFCFLPMFIVLTGLYAKNIIKIEKLFIILPWYCFYIFFLLSDMINTFNILPILFSRIFLIIASLFLFLAIFCLVFKERVLETINKKLS